MSKRQKSISGKKIILYGDRWGYFTSQARQWLKGHHLIFEEKDVSDPKVWKEASSLSEQYAIPVIAVGKEVVVGFDEKRLSRLLLVKAVKKLKKK